MSNLSALRDSSAETNNHDYSHFSGIISFPRGQHSLQVHWNVNDFRVTIIPPNHYDNLTEPERLRLFNEVLAKIRTRSEHPDDIYSAVLAITHEGNILVANNTQRQSEYHKDCAEINLVNIMTQLLGGQEKIERLYLMIGFTTPNRDTPDTQLERPMAPCGKCVDTLRSCTTPEAMITMLPVNDGSLPLVINHSAYNVGQLYPREAWETRLSALDINRVVQLLPEARDAGEQGWQALIDPTNVSKTYSEEEAERILRTSKKHLAPDEKHLKALMKRAALNAATGRSSEAALDLDHSPSGINHFMVQSITDAYRRRSPTGPEGQHNAETIRCVVIRLADGSFHSITEVEGPEENAVPPAEVTAVAATRPIHQRITDVWVMQMNRQDIGEGVMHTSPKEALERVYKRRPRKDSDVADYYDQKLQENVNVHFIPFNNGQLKDEQLETMTQRYSIQNIYISRYGGSRAYDQNDSPANGNGYGMR